MTTYEEWRPIPNYTDYEISRDGIVRSYKNTGKRGRKQEAKILHQHRDKDGRYRICLRRDDGHRIAEPVIGLMVRTWLVRPKGCIAYHINGIQSDNRIENIAFNTPAKVVSISMTRNHPIRRPVAKIDAEGNVVGLYKSIREASAKNYISNTAVFKRCHNLVTDPYYLDGYNYQFASTLEGEE